MSAPPSGVHGPVGGAGIGADGGQSVPCLSFTSPFVFGSKCKVCGRNKDEHAGRRAGTVSWYDGAKGFGVITCNRTAETFRVSYHEIVAFTSKSARGLSAGEPVEFEENVAHRVGDKMIAKAVTGPDRKPVLGAAKGHAAAASHTGAAPQVIIVHQAAAAAAPTGDVVRPTDIFLLQQQNDMKLAMQQQQHAAQIAAIMQNLNDSKLDNLNQHALRDRLHADSNHQNQQFAMIKDQQNQYAQQSMRDFAQGMAGVGAGARPIVHGRPAITDGTCFLCKQPGHKKQDCPRAARGGAASTSAAPRMLHGARPPADYTCKICGSPDHFIQDCPRYKPARVDKKAAATKKTRDQRCYDFYNTGVCERGAKCNFDHEARRQ